MPFTLAFRTTTSTPRLVTPTRSLVRSPSGKSATQALLLNDANADSHVWAYRMRPTDSALWIAPRQWLVPLLLQAQPVCRSTRRNAPVSSPVRLVPQDFSATPPSIIVFPDVCLVLTCVQCRLPLRTLFVPGAYSNRSRRQWKHDKSFQLAQARAQNTKLDHERRAGAQAT